ncbi:hypothetical protein EW093_01040 [Thiospirochaeta perfilievii]|uniref:Uncharacterized protein n=1 Tax=Thiospirochaeta perfilievii TaxID=252967 RepID=A0A5C1Q7R6_9SPIO|nr:hypothetical protein [Thiospirochaeta perfilievii]QEN03348.1 hypothetical protein EW093_01040 [Thiospirochaeta perfilievii]
MTDQQIILYLDKFFEKNGKNIINLPKIQQIQLKEKLQLNSSKFSYLKKILVMAENEELDKVRVGCLSIYKCYKNLSFTKRRKFEDSYNLQLQIFKNDKINDLNILEVYIKLFSKLYHHNLIVNDEYKEFIVLLTQKIVENKFSVGISKNMLENYDLTITKNTESGISIKLIQNV